MWLCAKDPHCLQQVAQTRSCEHERETKKDKIQKHVYTSAKIKITTIPLAKIRINGQVQVQEGSPQGDEQKQTGKQWGPYCQSANQNTSEEHVAMQECYLDNDRA